MKGDFRAILEVEGNDELLISILILLPQKSVFKLMSVSKRWYHIFDQPVHRRAYVNANTKRRQYLLGFVEKGCILPMPQTTDLNINRIIPSECGEYVNSSNGLILCKRNEQYHVLNNSSNGLILCKGNEQYHVLNPVTQARISFPGPGVGHQFFDVGLACIENSPRLAPSFKVVGTDVKNMKRVDNKTLLIGSYTSETRKWTESTLIGHEEFEVYAMPPFVFNGVYHWRVFQQHGRQRFLAVYDSNGDENHVQLIREPGSSDLDVFLTRSTHDDVIWIAKCNESCIWLWMLPKDEYGGRSYRRHSTITENEWILVQTINLDSLLLTIMSPSISYFCLEGLVPGNPVLAIFRMGRSTYIYDFERDSIECVPFEATSPSDSSSWLHNSSQSNWRYFYTGPFSLSAHALSS